MAAEHEIIRLKAGGRYIVRMDNAAIPEAMTGAEIFDLVRAPREPETPARYFLDRDNSGHWCIVPVAKRAEWEAWLRIPEDDERAWELPEGARMIGGAPTLYTFTDPQEV